MTSPTRHHRSLGLFWALTSAVLWSTTYIVVRVLAPYGIDGLTLSAIRFAIAALVLLIPALSLFRRQFLAVPRRDLGILALLSLFGIGGMSVLLFIGQAQTTAINGALIMQLSPVLILLLAAILGERIRVMQVAGIAIAMAGSLVIGEVWKVHGHWWGDLLILGSAVCWAVFSVLSRGVIARHGGFIATVWAVLFGAAMLVLVRLALPLPWPHLAPSLLALIFYLGVFPSAIAFVAWYESLNRLSLTLANAFQYLTPALAILLAGLLLNERLTVMHGIGIGTLILGIGLVSIAERKHDVRK